MLSTVPLSVFAVLSCEIASLRADVAGLRAPVASPSPSPSSPTTPGLDVMDWLCTKDPAASRCDAAVQTTVDFEKAVVLQDPLKVLPNVAGLANIELDTMLYASLARLAAVRIEFLCADPLASSSPFDCGRDGCLTVLDGPLPSDVFDGAALRLRFWCAWWNADRALLAIQEFSDIFIELRHYKESYFRESFDDDIPLVAARSASAPPSSRCIAALPVQLPRSLYFD